MKKLNIKGLMYSFLLVIILISCKEEKQEYSRFLNPPIPDLNPEYKTFKVNTEGGDTIVMESGTELFIAANAIYDSLGNLYQGNIEIKYREFNDALDIYLAGIPMEFYSMGQRKQMITAGMIEIRAYDLENNELFLKDNPIKIKYASKVEGNEYNFFGLNEETERWEFLDYPENEINPEIKSISDKIKQVSPKRKFPFGKDYFVFNYDAIIDVHFDMDASKFYKWRGEGREEIPAATRKAQKYGLTWSGLHNYMHINYYGNSRHAAMMVWKHVKGDPLTAAIAAPYKSTLLKHLKGNMYELKIFNDEGSTYYENSRSYKSNSEKFTMIIECIMPLQSLYKYSPSYWQKNYDSAIEKVKEYEKKYAEIAKVYRSGEIYQFGFYNFDALMKVDQNFDVKVKFIFKKNGEVNSIYQVKCMPGDNRSLINLNSGGQIWLDPLDTNYRIFTLTDDLKIALFPKEKYELINFDSLRNTSNPEYTFELDVIDKEIRSRDDIEKILNN